MTRTSLRASPATRRRRGDGRIAFVCALAPQAGKVCLAGDFNSWDPLATPMRKRGKNFVATLTLPPGEYEYKFVVDGQWFADPAAARCRPNPFGSQNSVVTVCAVTKARAPASLAGSLAAGS